MKNSSILKIEKASVITLAFLLCFLALISYQALAEEMHKKEASQLVHIKYISVCQTNMAFHWKMKKPNSIAAIKFTSS